MPRVSRQRLRSSSPAAAPVEASSGLQRAETAVHAALIAGMVVAFSTALQIQFTLPKLLILRAATGALLVLWIWRFRRDGTRPLPLPVLAAAGLLALWWTITTFNAVDPSTALDGAHGRFNGLSTNALLLTLFAVTASSPVPVKLLTIRVKVLVGSLLVAAIYTMVQSAGLDVFVWPFSRPASTIGHPVTLATALGIGAPFALVFALTRHGLARAAWAAAFVMLAAAAGLTLSRAPVMAMAASSALAIGLVAAPRVASRRTIRIAAALALLTILGAGVYVVRLRSGRFLPSLTQLSREPEIQNRLHTLRAAAGMVRDHPVAGVGLENYHVLYPRYRPVEAERLTPDSVPTMVHSGYFQAAVTTGIVGLGLYLLFVAAVMTSLAHVYRRAVEPQARALAAACIASASGYLVADVTGWPELPIVTLFMLVTGMGLSAAAADSVPRPRPAAIRMLVSVAAAGWLAVIVYLTFGALQMVRADYALRSAGSAAAAGDWPRAQALIEEGLDLQGSRAPYLDAAASLFAHRFGATGDRSLYDRAARLFEAAHARAPFSEYFMIHRLDLETAALQKQKGGAASQGANDAAAALLAVDRHNGTVYESLARMRLAEGAAPQALDMITRAEALRPHQADYWRLEGDIRRAMGDRRAAVAAYRHAAAGLPAGTAPWLNATRRLVVTLIEAGDYSGAIDEATRALALVPGDALTRQLLDAATGAKRAGATGS